jgi:hypothetical protein
MIFKALHLAQVTWIGLVEPLYMFLMATKYAPRVLLWQKHGPLEWQHLLVSESCTLIPLHTLISSLILKGPAAFWS